MKYRLSSFKDPQITSRLFYQLLSATDIDSEHNKLYLGGTEHP